MDFEINEVYDGPFEKVGEIHGVSLFNSGQRAAAPADLLKLREQLVDIDPQFPTSQKERKAPPGFEINTVEWLVDTKGHITGQARFIAMSTHDFVNAKLDGEARPAHKGDATEARVHVTFAGGSGKYARATGKASVIAKLFKNGLSAGRISGAVSVPDA